MFGGPDLFRMVRLILPEIDCTNWRCRNVTVFVAGASHALNRSSMVTR